MTKRITTVLGVLLFVLGVSSLLLLRQDRIAALEVDETFTSGDITGEENCQNVIRELSLPNRVMTEKESQSLRVVLSNLDNPGTCHTTVRLAALDFDFDPPATERPVTLEPDGTPVTVVWILKPEETGAFEIAVSAGNTTEVLGIVVTNVLGLTAVQVQILSYISSILGPMLTAPWWYEQWQKWRKARKAEAAREAKEAEAAKAAEDKAAGKRFRPE